MAKDGGAADPLRNPRFQEPSVWQLFRESLFGQIPACSTAYRWKSPPFARGAASIARIPRRPGYWRSRHMEAATFARLWPLMQESGRVHLQGWGEPFLHPRFMDFAALARKAGCRVSTTTCGLRMDETLAGQIRGERHRHCGLFPRGHRRGPAMPRALACRSAASVRPCARSSASAKAKMGVHLELHFAYLMLASQMEAVEGLPILWTNWTYTRR